MSNFFEHSKSIVEDFLQTAVFLDDRATFIYEEKVAEVIDTTPFRGIEKATEEPTEINPDDAIEEDTERTEHLLDAKTIIDTFMNKGIVCSVLKCVEETYDAQVTNYLKLLRKADMVVLDWDLFRDNGDRVVFLLSKLLESETDLHPFRSIVIYTANNLESVKKKLSEKSITFPEDSYVSDVPSNYTSISIYSKPFSKEAIEERTVDFSELVNKCIKDFTTSFHGIVPNVTMAAISEIRNNTHNLLSVLNKNLDIAYLSHRALLPYPEDAEKHIEEIIISEIESIIHENNIGKNAALNIIKEHPHLLEKKYKGINFIDCLENGVETYISTNKEKSDLKKDIKKCFTKAWYESEEVAKNAEIKFVKLTTLQTKYTNEKNLLSLGLIIEQLDTQEKYLCLQPRCDSVRLIGDTEFILLLLDSSNDKFDLLCNDDEKYKIKYNKEFRKTISFKICDSEQAVIPNEDLYYEDSNSKKYKYLAKLKPMQAQKISNEYGSYLSRVGLNESEYLRRNR